MNVIQEAIMTKYGLEIGQEFYILYNKSFDGYKIGEKVNNYKYHFDETGEVVNQRGQRKISILGGLVVERFSVEKVKTFKLKRMEKDILSIVRCKDVSFYIFGHLIDLKKLGYFKDVDDGRTTIQEILDNCEVIDGD